MADIFQRAANKLNYSYQTSPIIPIFQKNQNIISDGCVSICSKFDIYYSILSQKHQTGTVIFAIVYNIHVAESSGRAMEQQPIK